MADTHVLEIRAGRGEPALLELRPGVEIPPLSVGPGGAWKISASGMKSVHAYLYFDGEVLFLQSADGGNPATMNGRPVPAEWTPVDAPCTVTMGQAQLVLRRASSVDVADEEPTFAEPIPDPLARNPTPPPPAPRARPFKPGAFARPVDDESTRLQPVAMEDAAPDSNDATRVEPAPPGRELNVRPAAGVPWDQSGTSPRRGAISGPHRPPAAPPEDEGDPTVFGTPQLPSDAYSPGHPYPPPPAAYPQQPPGFQGMPPTFGRSSVPGPPPGPVDPASLLNVPPPSLPRPPVEEPITEKIKREWKAAPPLRKGLIAAFPLAFAGFLWVMFGGEPASGPSGVVAAPSASLPPAASSAAPPRAVSATQDPGALPVIPSYAPVDPTSPRGAGVVATTAPQLPTGPDAGQASSDRRERQAADFVATHAYDQAIRIYDQLAIDRPQNPAFHEAARILRQKLDSGTP